MSLIQLPKVIQLVNELSEKVHKLEAEVKALQEYNAVANKQAQVSKPKKND